MADASHQITAVIPVYGSADILPALAERLGEALSQLATDFEVIFVNDDSPDDAWNVIEQLMDEHTWVRGIALSRNAGQHNAILCGIRHAEYPIVVTLDDDLQHPPEAIGTLLEALTDDIDVVYGPPDKEQHGLFRDLASRVTKLVLQSAMGAETARHISAFRVFRTHLRNGFAEFTGPFANIDVMLTWGTRRFAAVKVRHDPRHSGDSGYTFRKLVRHAMNMITGFSTMPLQLASYIGFGLTLFGIAILAWVVGRFIIEGVSVPGFAFLASTIAVFSGAQLFALGIIGEYLARMHFRMMDRPTYVIRHDDELP